MDINLVTRKNYSDYLEESGYQAKENDSVNFLKGWTWNDGYKYPEGTEDVPVTSITVQEA